VQSSCGARLAEPDRQPSADPSLALGCKKPQQRGRVRRADAHRCPPANQGKIRRRQRPQPVQAGRRGAAEEPLESKTRLCPRARRLPRVAEADLDEAIGTLPRSHQSQPSVDVIVKITKGIDNWRNVSRNNLISFPPRPTDSCDRTSG
jgi:hypothetical protein